MAPELKNKKYEGPPIDVWSLGIIMNDMLAGLENNCFEYLEVFDSYTNVTYAPPLFVTESCASLLTCMICKNPLRRITTKGIMNHVWFEKLPLTPWKTDLNAEAANKNASATPNQAASATPNQAASATPNQAASGTPNQAAGGTPNQADSGTPNQADSGTPNQADSGTPNQAARGTPGGGC
uniref:non-specific serine/threonine protein kinase n=1 Tax=Eptatretus burgeri TaxID=7764 RepID=A0A8C4QSZ7_EPTBU